MVDTSAKTILRNPEPHNPNYDIPQGHFRVDIPWEYSVKLGLTFDAPDCLVYKLGDIIVLSALELDGFNLELFNAVPLYFFKDNGWDGSTDIDECYDGKQKCLAPEKIAEWIDLPPVNDDFEPNIQTEPLSFLQYNCQTIKGDNAKAIAGPITVQPFGLLCLTTSSEACGSNVCLFC